MPLKRLQAASENDASDAIEFDPDSEALPLDLPSEEAHIYTREAVQFAMQSPSNRIGDKSDDRA